MSDIGPCAFKLSADPRFEERLRDVVGLYLDAAVFSYLWAPC